MYNFGQKVSLNIWLRWQFWCPSPGATWFSNLSHIKCPIVYRMYQQNDISEYSEFYPHLIRIPTSRDTVIWKREVKTQWFNLQHSYSILAMDECSIHPCIHTHPRMVKSGPAHPCIDTRQNAGEKWTSLVFTSLSWWTVSLDVDDRMRWVPFTVFRNNISLMVYNY